MIIKTISSLEKCFLDDNINSKKECNRGSMLKNEEFRFQVCYNSEEILNSKQTVLLSVESHLNDYIHVSRIEHVPVQMPINMLNCDDNYLRKTPGLYPDILLPIEKNSRLVLTNNLESLMVTISLNGEVKPGIYPIKIIFLNGLNKEKIIEVTYNIEIIDALLPEQELIFTQWLHCDCLQHYYETKSFDEKHWSIIENFLKTAVKRGMNMVLTPVFTPPLDTYVGGERSTTQLVDIEYQGGNYNFDFSRLGLWIDMCDRVGIKYFEISHFFTQWGAQHAPKIVANVDGQTKKIFGWETDACGKEYSGFLKCFIPKLIEYLKNHNGADKRCWFHVSDEPQKSAIPDYTRARRIVADLLKGYHIIDALSEYEFYEKGIVTNPIVSNDLLEPFIENKVSPLWTYYAVEQSKDVSNRFISMPSQRNRIIGLQFYKYDIAGFLQWGFNFYNNQLSYASINPYLCTDGEYFTPAGDTFSVYPAPDGKPYESIRLVIFFDAIQDLRRLKLCESIYGYDYVIKLIEENITPITFKKFPHSDEWFLSVIKKVNMAIKFSLNR